MKKVMLLFSIFLVLTALTIVSASEVNQTNSTDSSTNQTNITIPATNTTHNTTNNNQNKSVNWTIRCEAVNHRVEGRIAHFESEDPHFKRVTKLNESLQMIATKAKEKGLNTSLLEADLLVLNEKIATFQDDYALFIQKLKDTRNYTCGHSEGQYKAALNESKAQLRIVKQDADDIKEFVKTTIKDDLSFLREGAKERHEEKRREHMDEQRKKIEERMEKFRNESEKHRAELEKRDEKIREKLDKLRNDTELRQKKLDEKAQKMREELEHMEQRKRSMHNESEENESE